jgi:hypothetical protein
MKLTLPIIKDRVYDKEKKEVKTTRGTLDVQLITSYRAHLKWEEQFQKTLGIDLVNYTQRVHKWAKSEDTAKANLLGILKVLYCHVDSPELPDFAAFTDMLDYSLADEILEVLSVVLDEIGKSASKN